MPSVDSEYAMNPAVAKRKAKEKKGSDHKEPDADDRQLDRLEVKTADNGFTVTSHHKAKPSKGKGDLASYEPAQDKVFESADSALGHISAKLRAHERAHK